ADRHFLNRASFIGDDDARMVQPCVIKLARWAREFSLSRMRGPFPFRCCLNGCLSPGKPLAITNLFHSSFAAISFLSGPCCKVEGRTYMRTCGPGINRTVSGLLAKRCDCGGALRRVGQLPR